MVGTRTTDGRMPDATSPQSPLLLADEALALVVQLHSGHASEQDRRACEAWQTRSPAHRLAFQQAETLWEAIGRIPAVGADSTPSVSTALARRVPHRSRRRMWSIAACLLLWLLWVSADPLLMGLRLATADHRTDTGEQHVVILQDGTRVMLNTDTALNVAFSAQQREVRLLKGEAAFSVTPDRDRPFIVQSGEVTTRALGTSFVVHLHPHSVTVTVSEHAVQVSTSPTDTGTPIVLQEGQQASYSEERGWSPPQAIDSNQVLAWQRGKLIFEEQFLGAVVEELNRYRSGRILILNPALRTLKVTGVFDLADPDTALRMIERTLRIHETSLSPYLVLLH